MKTRLGGGNSGFPFGIGKMCFLNADPETVKIWPLLIIIGNRHFGAIGKERIQTNCSLGELSGQASISRYANNGVICVRTWQDRINCMFSPCTPVYSQKRLHRSNGFIELKITSRSHARRNDCDTYLCRVYVIGSTATTWYRPSAKPPREAKHFRIRSAASTFFNSLATRRRQKHPIFTNAVARCSWVLCAVGFNDSMPLRGSEVRSNNDPTHEPYKNCYKHGSTVCCIRVVYVLTIRALRFALSLAYTRKYKHYLRESATNHGFRSKWRKQNQSYTIVSYKWKQWI